MANGCGEGFRRSHSILPYYSFLCVLCARFVGKTGLCPSKLLLGSSLMTIIYIHHDKTPCAIGTWIPKHVMLMAGAEMFIKSSEELAESVDISNFCILLLERPYNRQTDHLNHPYSSPPRASLKSSNHNDTPIPKSTPSSRGSSYILLTQNGQLQPSSREN